MTQIVAAADDRIKLAGDILDYDDFFMADESLPYDEVAFEKRLRADLTAVQMLRSFRAELANLEPFTATSTDACLKQFVESQRLKSNQIINTLRVS